MLNQLMLAMCEFDRGVPHRIQHFTKVHAYCRLIGQEEGLDGRVFCSGSLSNPEISLDQFPERRERFLLTSFLFCFPIPAASKPVPRGPQTADRKSQIADRKPRLAAVSWMLTAVRELRPAKIRAPRLTTYNPQLITVLYP